jgi:tetratricopeptide (TPR) repeat protein
MRRRVLPALVLALLTAAAFEPVRDCAFVNIDDLPYVARNPHLRAGLSAAGLRWAWGADLITPSPYIDYWSPLTATSRLLDASLFGLDPAGHHLTNLAFHALSTALLFLVIEAMTGRLWASAFVAAAFGVHPQHVESVAWISERKDVLSGLFFVLTLAAYVRHVRAPSAPRLLAVAGVYALGLLSKPMVMTLPFVLLLLDYWPLGRFAADQSSVARLRPLVLEKLPLLALTLLSVLATFLPLREAGHLSDFGFFPLHTRLANAAYSCLSYAAKTAWPHPLAVVYPYPHDGVPAADLVLGIAFVVGGTTLAVLCRHSCPAVTVGWLWYLGMLVPVLGIVQSGAHARADRYTYLPLIGLTIASAWGASAATAALPRVRRALTVAAWLAVAVWLLLTRDRLRDWTDSETLFASAVSVTSGNYVAHNNLATALSLRGALPEAEAHYREALRSYPAYGEARTNLGVVLERQGRLDEAVEQYRIVLRGNPGAPRAHLQLGMISARRGAASEAARHYEAALRSDPKLAVAHYNLGNLLARAGRLPEAERHYAQAVAARPDDPEALNNLGLAQGLQGRWAEAAVCFERALTLDPHNGRARTNLGRALAAQGHLKDAIREYERVLTHDPRDADAHYYLGLAVQAGGDLEGAIAHYEQALRSTPGFAEAENALRRARQASPAGAPGARRPGAGRD